jgi:signal transduction histidine kinase
MLPSPTSPAQETDSPLDPTTLIQLLRQMNHDMRGPLGVLTVVRMQRSSDRLLSLLDCFITYVKANSGQYPLITSAFDPQALLESLVAKAKPYADEKHIVLHLTTEGSCPATINQEEVGITQILTALLWNAIGFTSTGSVSITSNWSESDTWVITVQDTGPGISADAQPRIFEPLWHELQSTVVPASGSGLGLAMARALARVLRGRLTLAHTGPEGSTFRLCLPREGMSSSTLTA